MHPGVMLGCRNLSVTSLNNLEEAEICLCINDLRMELFLLQLAFKLFQKCYAVGED